TTPIVIQITDATGNPVVGAQVTFAPTPDSEQIDSTTTATGSAGTAGWYGTFHAAGLQHITASTPGLAPVTFTIDVIATPFTFDGVYDCSFDGGPPALRPMHIVSDQVVDQGDYGHVIWGGSVDHTTGTFSGFYHPSLDVYNNMSGQFAVDVTPGGAAGSGTYVQGGPVGSGPGTWQCTRE